MPAVAGSIESVTLDGRTFAVAADAESNRKLGGYENESQPNGDGSARLIKTRVSWMLDGIAVEVDDTRGDQEYIQSLTDGNDYFPIAITYASQEVYQGQGQVVAESQASSQAGTMPISLSGPGVLTRQ